MYKRQVLTGANHGKGEDKEAFCSGGDQSVRGHGGYVGEDNVPRLNVLDLQRLIRVIPKPCLLYTSSIRDEESIKAADEAGIAMVFTSIRHFKH